MNSKKKKNGVAAILLVTFTGAVFLLFFITPLLKQKLAGWAKKRVVSYVAENSDYNLTIDSLTFEGFTNIKLHTVKLENKLGRKEFNIKNKYQTDWIRFETREISFKDIQWRNWFKDKGIRMGEMVLNAPDVYVYRDKRIPQAPYVVKPLPMKFLRESKQQITVPVIKLNNAVILYEEVLTDGKAKFSFKKVNALIKDFSSDKAYISSHQALTMKATASFLDTVQISIAYAAQINNPQDQFSLQGKVSGFPAMMLNEFLEPYAKVKIETGKISEINFRFTADDDKAKGSLDLKYENLKTIVMSSSDPEKKSKIKSWIANALVRDNNTRKFRSDDFKKGIIDYERKKNKSVFHYWVNAVGSGVVSVVTDVDVTGLKRLKQKVDGKFK